MKCKKCGHENKPECLNCEKEMEKGKFCSGACRQAHWRKSQENVTEYNEINQEPVTKRNKKVKTAPVSCAAYPLGPTVSLPATDTKSPAFIDKTGPSKKAPWCGLKGFEA